MFKELILSLNFLVLPDVTVGQQGYFIAKDIRSITQDKIIITSNCRNKRINNFVGGVPNSVHLQCKALDIRSKGLKTKTLNEIKSLTNTGRYDVIVEYNPPHIHIELKEGQLTLHETWNDLTNQ